jgi:hypothetical protein
LLNNVCILCRWLPDGHHFHADPAFGPQRATDPPAPRTHAETVKAGEASDAWTGPDNGHPRYASGVNSLCALTFLYLFDIIWDVCPDMMHIIKNWFEKLTFRLFAGLRIPQWSSAKNPKPKQGVADYPARKAKYKRQKALYKRAVAQTLKCTFPAADQAVVDRRIKNLVGPATWIKNSLVHTRMYNYVFYVTINVYGVYKYNVYVAICFLVHTKKLHL